VRTTLSLDAQSKVILGKMSSRILKQHGYHAIEMKNLTLRRRIKNMFTLPQTQKLKLQMIFESTNEQNDFSKSLIRFEKNTSKKYKMIEILENSN